MRQQQQVSATIYHPAAALCACSGTSGQCNKLSTAITLDEGRNNTSTATPHTKCATDRWAASQASWQTHTHTASTLLFSLCIRGMEASGSTAACSAASPPPSPPPSARDAMYLRCSSSKAVRCASALASFSAASFPFAVVGADEDEDEAPWFEELLPTVAGRPEVAAGAVAAVAGEAGAGAGAGVGAFAAGFATSFATGFASFSHGFAGEDVAAVAVVAVSSAGAAAAAAVRAGERAGAGAGADAGSSFKLSMNRRCSASNSACCASRSLRFCSANASFFAFCGSAGIGTHHTHHTCRHHAGTHSACTYQ